MENSRREQVRELRQQGYSVKDIVDLTGAAKSSVSVWTRDIELTPEQRLRLKQRHRHHEGQQKGAEANRQKGMRLRQQYQEVGREKAREKSPLHMMGCMLYWAEGAKTRNEVYFVNSDSNMMLTFIRFLRQEMGIANETMKIHIHCHTTEKEEIANIENYWLDLLQLPRSCLNKTQIKKGTIIRNNVLHHGVCGIRITKTELAQHIYGAIQEYTGLDNPEWLFPVQK